MPGLITLLRLAVIFNFKLSTNNSDTQQYRRTCGTEGDKKGARERVLMTLARALENNTTSEELWRVYLHFYLREENLPPRPEMQGLLESGVRFLPRSYMIWRMYILLLFYHFLCSTHRGFRYISNTEELSERVNLCERALKELSSSILDDKERDSLSADILDMTLLLVYILIQAGKLESARGRLYNLLFKATAPSSWDSSEINSSTDSSTKNSVQIMKTLTAEHRCILALSYIYLLAYNRLPFIPNSALRFPQEVFLIDWRQLAANVQLEVNSAPLMRRERNMTLFK